jgi:DNA polymerase-3 subunit delta
MILVISGNNHYATAKRLEELLANFLTKESDLAVEHIDGEEADMAAILDAVASMPFLANKKMVVIKSLGANKQAAEHIEQIISSTSSTTDLIIVEASTDRRSAFYKYLKQNTELEEYNEIDPKTLPLWLVAEAKKLEASLSLSDARYLVERLGPDQALLFSELEKLAIYDPQITKQTIDQLTDKTPQSKVFDLMDAAFTGNKQKAIDLYDDQRAQRVEPQAILALLIWQLNLICYAKYGSGKSAETIAKDTKASSYPVSKAQTLAQKISLSKLSSLINQTLQIDYKSKSSGIDLDEALKNLILEL